MRDPYEVLGVDRKASAGDIKSAFRRLAKKLHPDANKNDPKAAGRFAEINAAYELLGEDDKRKAFDRGEIDAEGKPRFRGFGASAAARAHARAAASARRPSSRPSPTVQRALRAAPSVGAPAGGAGGFGGFEDILREAFAGGGARRGGRCGRLRGRGSRRRNEYHGGFDRVAAGCGAWRNPACAAALREGCRGQDFPPASPMVNKFGCAGKAWPAPAAPATF